MVRGQLMVGLGLHLDLSTLILDREHGQGPGCGLGGQQPQDRVTGVPASQASLPCQKGTMLGEHRTRLDTRVLLQCASERRW